MLKERMGKLEDGGGEKEGGCEAYTIWLYRSLNVLVCIYYVHI